MTAIIMTIVIASGALIFGAVWGSVWGMSKRLEGFMIALAGGALIVGAMDQMVSPALEHSSHLTVCVMLLIGASVFSIADRWIETRGGATRGMGLALAVTVDGVPENLALGTALISSTPLETSALAAAILLSNLPESAGGARIMYRHGKTPRQIITLWSAVALLLAASGLGGYWLLSGVSEHHLAWIHAFAAGAVLSSLATEVFPAAYRDNAHDAGIAIAIGVVLALMLTAFG